MSGEEDPRHPFDGILDGLADSIAEESATELRDEAQASAQDPAAIARDVRNTLQAALKKFEQRKLEAAREAVRRHGTAQSHKSQRIAISPAGRKQQLFTILQNNPKIGAVLTSQHREFESLSDEDVESALEDLAELGYLDNSFGPSQED